MTTRRNGGRLGKINLPTTITASGMFSLSDVQQNRTNGTGSWPIGLRDGSTAALAADSAAAIKAAVPSAGSGVYWILVNGTAKQVYCDMTNDGGGRMLWQTFGSSSAFQSGYAILPNGSSSAQMTTNGWTNNAGGWGIYAGSVGVGLACYAEGTADTNTIGATLNIVPTLLRTQYGNTHVVSSVEIFTNGVSRGSASPGQTITATSVPINFSGTTPVFRIKEYNAIMAFYWAMIK